VQSAKDGLIADAGASAGSGDIVLIKGYRDVSTMLGSNVTTPYILSHFDLSDGPMVLEYASRPPLRSGPPPLERRRPTRRSAG